jgi:hypothetical protein
MHTRTTWQISGVTHWATVFHDDCNGNEIRTDCGLVNNSCWESEVNELAEVTCSRCRLSGGTNRPEPHTERTSEEKAPSNKAAKEANKPPLPALFEEADLIHVYSRQQAIEDGVLIDVTPTAKEAGFCFPVAVTATLWSQYVHVPDGVEAQDEAGRLWDILQMLRYAIRQRRNHADTFLFTVSVRNDQSQPQSAKLKAVCGPDDAGAPCFTLMLAEED